MGELEYSVTTEHNYYEFSEEPCFGALNNMNDRREYEDDNSSITGLTWRFKVHKDPGVTMCIGYLMNRCRYTKHMNVNITSYNAKWNAVCIELDVHQPANRMMWQMCVWRDLVEKFQVRNAGTRFVDIVKCGCNETLALILAEAGNNSDEYATYNEESIYHPMTLSHTDRLVTSNLSYGNPEPESYAGQGYYNEIKTYWAEPTGGVSRSYRKSENFLINFKSVHEALDFFKDYDGGRLFNKQAE